MHISEAYTLASLKYFHMHPKIPKQISTLYQICNVICNFLGFYWSLRKAKKKLRT